MPNFVATILDVKANSNPEYCYFALEAKDEAAAKKQAKAAMASGACKGWTSYRDVDLWGKVQTVLVDVVPEEDDVKRRGRGNNRGEEAQAEREERFRKAAKV